MADSGEETMDWKLSILPAKAGSNYGHRGPVQSIPAGRERGVPESNHVLGLPHTYMSCRMSMVWPGGSPSTCPAGDRDKGEGSRAQHSTPAAARLGQVCPQQLQAGGRPIRRRAERIGSRATRIAPTLSSGGESNSFTYCTCHTYIHTYYIHACIHTYISNYYSIMCEAMSSRCANLPFLPSFLPSA